jgi:hypothetical protein
LPKKPTWLLISLTAVACGGTSQGSGGNPGGTGADGGRNATVGGATNGTAAQSGLAGQTGVVTSGGMGGAGNTSNGNGGASGSAASSSGGVAGDARAGAGSGGRVMQGMAGVGGALQACVTTLDCTGETPAGDTSSPLGRRPYGDSCSHDGDYCWGTIHGDLTSCFPWYALCCDGKWAEQSADSVNGARTCPAAGGAAGQGGEAGSGGQRAIECTGSAQYFPDFDRSCATAGDCAAVIHQTNCCGAESAFGIRASELSAFNAAEATCDQQYPACGCASFGVDVEDGTRVDFGAKDQIAVSCDAGSCKAHYSGTSFACGTLRCIENQYCEQSSGGPSGTPTSYSCNPSGCTDCSCLTLADCTCSEQNGQLTLTCQHA